MTKAKKGLIITLFAAMMVFAFGATSAFAAEKAVWGEDYSYVKVGSNTYDTVRIANLGMNDSFRGNVTAYFDTTGMSAGAIADLKAALDVTTLPTVTYYDASNSAIDLFGTMTQTEFNGKYSYDEDTDEWAWNNVNLVFSVPSYCENAKENSAAKGEAPATNTPSTKTRSVLVGGSTPSTPALFSDWQISLSQAAGYQSGLFTDQTFTLNTAITRDTQTASDQSEIYGTVPAKIVKVLAATPLPSNAKFYFDEEEGTAFSTGSGSPLNTVYYDGAEHTVVMGDLPGFEAKYAILGDNGKYNDVLAVSVKDHAKKAIKVRATVTKTTDATVKAEFYFSVNASAAAPVKFSLDQEGNAGAGKWSTPESTFDGYSIVLVESTATGTGDAAKASKAAVKADQATWMEYFKEAYDVNAKNTRYAEDTYTLSIEPKDLTKDEAKALKEKYATLLGDYGTPIQYSTATVTAEVNAPVVGKTDHIYFTEAPNMTYKAKKIKKASKSFTVAAVADSGNAVTYKISSPTKKITINSETGKVTVKKGLKKGSYKVKVYAQTAGGNGYNPAYTYQPAQLTIKIKK